MDEYKMLQYGWICPQCGRSLSPTTPSCPFCGGNSYNYNTTGVPPPTPKDVIMCDGQLSFFDDPKEDIIIPWPQTLRMNLWGTTSDEDLLDKNFDNFEKF